MQDAEVKSLRELLIWNLKGGGAHAGFDEALTGLPEELLTKIPDGFPHSAWQLLEHLRIAQWDILEFSRSATHKSPAWPDGYWPKNKKPTSSDWKHSAAEFHAELGAMARLIETGDLFTPFPWGEGQTLLREALLLADHNSYHLGQLIAVRKALGEWT